MEVREIPWKLKFMKELYTSGAVKKKVKCFVFCVI